MKDKVYVLTEQSIMQNVLEEYGIDVSIQMAKSIYERFMEQMVFYGYIKENEE